MAFQLLWILVPVAIVSAQDSNLPSSCTFEYELMSDHTMCVYEDAEGVVEVPLTAADKTDILQIHNDYRKNVLPKATDMQKMYWDDELAVIAAKWARVCITGHDSLRGRHVPGYGLPVGQNYAFGTDNWAAAIRTWFLENLLYTYGEHPPTYIGEDGWKDIAHYTQVVRNISSRVGCGKAICPENKEVYVCNYAHGNPEELAYPYTSVGDSEEPCSACPDTCSDNLCDCEGKLCLNGGTLDPNTCTCSCYDLFTGDTCDQPICTGAEDASVCRQPRPGGFPDDKCYYRNVRLSCPIMCGICPGVQY